jgi:hypothetical protein
VLSIVPQTPIVMPHETLRRRRGNTFPQLAEGMITTCSMWYRTRRSQFVARRGAGLDELRDHAACRAFTQHATQRIGTRS